MQRFGGLVEKLMRHNGANPTYSRHLRGLLLQAGFVRTEGFAVAADYAGNLDVTRHSATIWVKILYDPARSRPWSPARAGPRRRSWTS